MRKIPKKNSGFSAGFTLFEIVLSMGILAAVLFIITVFGLDVADFGGFLSKNLTSQQELQQTLKVMRIEMRAMAASNTGIYPIEAASATSLVFYSDFDNDGLCERLRYWLENGTLKKGIIIPQDDPLVYNPADEKITEVVHFISPDSLSVFSYFSAGQEGSETPLSEPVSPASIRAIRVNLVVDEDPQRLPLPVQVDSFITIRNLREI